MVWVDIIVSVCTAVGEALFCNILEKSKQKKTQKKLNKIINESTEQLKDSSLNSEEFLIVIKQKEFVELIRKLFLSTDNIMFGDNNDKKPYIDGVINYISIKCPNINVDDVKDFIKCLIDNYNTYLYKVVQENPEINAIFQLLMFSQREILCKISQSDEDLKKYFKSLENKNKIIDDKHIIAYHSVCEKEYSNIRFTGISGVENRNAQKLNEFYVENTFTYSRINMNQYKQPVNLNENLKLNEIFNYCNKIVLIGGAGLGKSTTLNYLFCNYENLYGLNPLKIKLDLKEYANDIGRDKKDILWCLTTEFYKKIYRSELKFEDIEFIISKYLSEGSCLVILDALDEIPTQSVRNKVRDRIEEFCDLYYLNRIIISTREAGYLKNRFDNTFLHIRIDEFNDDQIKKYSKNWYNSYYSITAHFDDFWEKFRIEVNRAKCNGLIRNPIILILALVIFDIEKNLPNKRVEFYKKCIDTFLVVREDRKAVFELSEKAKNILGIDLIIPKVAYYKFDHISANSKYRFTKEELIQAVLQAIETSDEIYWREAINQYTQYLIERTELIHEVDEDILDFAHKTFYEYFLAVYFAKELKVDELIKLLDKWIGDSNYDELARLIIEIIIQNDIPSQHKAVMEYLFEKLNREANADNNVYDIFSIIVDLYSHNMLQPKFHQLYNDFILKNAIYTFRYNRNYINSDVELKYDSRVLSNMFLNQINSNNDMHRTIESLYYLDNDYRQYVIKNSPLEYVKHTCLLLATVYNYIYSRKQKIKGTTIKQELSYFLNEGLIYTLTYPQIYISVIGLMALTDDFSQADKLVDYSFDCNSYFLNYTNPNILYRILKSSMNSADSFIVTLIGIIWCAKNNTNYLFGFLFDSRNKRSSELLNVYLWIWQLLNDSKNYESFKCTLSEKGLFNSEYNNTYQTLFYNYKKIESIIPDRRINEYFKANKS